MNAKKTPRANLENKRFIFMQVWLIVTLALVLLAFEWKSYDSFIALKQDKTDFTPQDLAPITIQKKVLPPPVAPPTIFDPVVNESEILDDIDWFNPEIGDDTEIHPYIPKMEKEEIIPDDIPLVSPQEMPSFPGGENARRQFMQDNLKFGRIARETGIQGSVYVTFIVEKDGSVTNVELLRGIGGGCDEAAIEMVAKMPKWNPGRQNGHPVRVQLNMPIKFSLL